MNYSTPDRLARPSRLEQSRWLISHTRSLLPPLGGSVAAAVTGRLAWVALLATATGALSALALGRPVSVPTLIAWLVGLALVKAVLSYLEHYLGHWVAFTALQRLRELFFASLIPQAPAATAGRAGAELTERATRDIDRIEVFFAHTLPPAVAAVAVPAVTLAVLATRETGLAAALAPFTVAVLAMPLLTARGSARRGARIAERRAEVAVQLGDNVQGAREIVSFGAEERRLGALAEADTALARARAGAGLAQGTRAAASTALRLGSLLAVLTVAAQTGADPATVVLALTLAVALWGPGRGIDDFAASLDTAFAATARVREVIDGVPLVQDTGSTSDTGSTGAPKGPIHAPAVAMREVTFAYPGSPRPTLERVSFAVPRGEWAFVVGVSGSGKSTVAELLLRGWDPQHGGIELRGAPVRELPLDTLRARVAHVSQRPVMLTTTLAENLRLAAPTASDAELREALFRAALEQWAEELPAGLDTLLDGRGLSISGGQLHRLAIARALLQDPEVLILDEALSQLDHRTGDLVRERVAALPGLTVVEITHRVDLLPASATAHVLDEGRLCESGTVAQLRDADGPFSRLLARV